MSDVVNLRDKLARFEEPWSPRVVADLNDHQVKVVKLAGEFVWHRHEHEDEMFLVVAGRLLMRFRDREVWLDEGEMIVVPRGVEHQPVAPSLCHVMLIEPRSTLNTGDVRNERTVEHLERL